MPGPKPTQSKVAAAISTTNATTITTRIITARLLLSMSRVQARADPPIRVTVSLFPCRKHTAHDGPTNRPNGTRYPSSDGYQANVRATLYRQRGQRKHPAGSPPRTNAPCDSSPSELWWPLPGLCCCLGHLQSRSSRAWRRQWSWPRCQEGGGGQGRCLRTFASLLSGFSHLALR